MKLTRNKIRKIHRQQNQSVRKWKNIQHRKKAKRYNTFRRSSSVSLSKSKLGFVEGARRAHNESSPAKLSHVLNKTLKNYIPSPVLMYLKQKYNDMNRAKRHAKKMKGGGFIRNIVSKGAATAAAAAAAAAEIILSKKPKEAEEPAADAAAPEEPAADSAPEEPAAAASEEADAAAAPEEADAAAAPEESDAAAAPEEAEPAAAADDAAAADADDAKPKNGPVSKAKFNLGPEITGDISIHAESFTLKSKEAYHFIDFLITSGKPYYIQIKPKVGDKTLLNISDTDIFELRRILYGNFATKQKYEVKDGADKIPDDKLALYFKSPDVIGIAGGDSISIDGNGNIMIYTGETAQVMSDSTDKIIKLEVQGNKKQVTVTDSKRLYKLGGNGQAPATIKTVEMRQTFGNNITEDEFRAQISPVTELTLKSASGAKSDDKEEVFSDESNTYIVNFSDGSEVTAIQTLRKALEVARKNIVDEENDDKSAALGIMTLLYGILSNPEFVKSGGYDDFKESVFNFSYKIPGMENKYGFAQMKTYFEENGDDMSPGLVKEFWRVMTLLGHGPGGENSACLAFEKPGLSVKVMTTLTPMVDGTTKQTSEIFNDGTVPTIATLLEKGLGAANAEEEKEDKEKKKDGEEGGEEGAGGEGEEGGEGEGEGEAAGAEGEGEAAVEAGEAAAGEGEAAAEAAGAEAEAGTAAEAAAGAEGEAAAEGAEAEGAKKEEAAATAPGATAATAAAAAAAAAAAEIILASKNVQIEKVDIKRVWGEWQKGYIVKRYKFDNLPPMLLVHYMGELLSEDEFIPASKESEKIRPRTETSIVGGVGIADQDPESLMSFYTESTMKNYDIDAKAAATTAAAATPADATPAAAAAAAGAADTSAIHITPQEVRTTPETTSEAITAMNTLYAKYDKKAEKVQKILGLKKSFNAKIKSLATQLLEMYTKSLESHATWTKNGARKSAPRNLYIDSDQFDTIKKQFEEALKSIKNSDEFKYIDGDTGDCDKIISDFKPSNWKPAFFTSKENKDLLIKICRLFSMYKRWMGQIELYNDYFKKWNDLKGGWDLKFNKQSQETVIKNFNYYSDSLTGMLKDLDKDVKDTEVLEQGVVEPQPQGGGSGNKRKNRTRRRAKPAK